MPAKKNPQIVTAAVIEKDGLILIGKRRYGKRHAGVWEFPGGTLEDGETYEQCLKRELMEELAVTAEIGDLLCSSTFSYEPDWTIQLMAYRATIVSGVFNLNDHEELRWVKKEDLINYNFPEADKLVIETLLKEGHP